MSKLDDAALEFANKKSAYSGEGWLPPLCYEHRANEIALSFQAGTLWLLEEARKYCETQTVLSDGDGNDRFDEEEWDAENKNAGELKEFLEQLCKGEDK